MTNEDTADDGHNDQKKRMLSALAKAEASNREAMKQLGMRGMNPNPLDLSRLRLEVFITMTLGNKDSLQRLQFELAWQQQLQEYFADMYQSAQKTKLHVPGRD